MNYSITNTFHPCLLLPTSLLFLMLCNLPGKPSFIHILHSFIYSVYLLSIYQVPETSEQIKKSTTPSEITLAYPFPPTTTTTTSAAAQPILPHTGVWVNICISFQSPPKEGPRLDSSSSISKPRPQPRRCPQM